MDIQTQKDDRKSAKTRVKVAIRVRPMIPKQIASNQNTCVEFKGSREIILARDRNYKFDQVFPDHTPQLNIYESCVKDLILGCFEGYNAAILAYGQTGSGKTFTMGTAINTFDSQQNQGIIPRVVQQIFHQVKLREKKAQFIIKSSFLEIYNEQIIDLLSDSNLKNNKNKDQMITIREEKDGSVSICNVTEEEVTTEEQMMDLLERGGYHRTTACTLMNDASSRSHAIFTVFIEQHRIDDLYQKDDKKKEKNESDDGFMTAKFFFVDLAGSERAKKTGATGTTLKQGININLGLLQLGNVISALATIQKKQDQFITYRNSKLTRILQQCLGGNSNTYMIACISPAQSNFQESLNTLKYASKAMNIKNKPIKNIDPHTAQISQLKQKIFELEAENRKLKGLLNEKGVSLEQFGQSPDLMQEQVKKMKKIYLALQKKHEQALNQLKEQKRVRNQYQIKCYEVKRSCDLLRLKMEILQDKYPQEFAHNGSDSADSSLQQSLQNDKRLSVLNELTEKIQSLTNQLTDKDRTIAELEKGFENLQENSRKDEKLLIAKNNAIYQLKKENEKYKRAIHGFKKMEQQKSNGDMSMMNQQSIVQDEDQPNLQQYQGQYSELELSQLPLDFLENEQSFTTQRTQKQHLLSSVDKQIQERQNYLESISTNQIKLEYQLISEMKEEYHNKILLLEKQKSGLIKMRDESIVTNEKNKFINKIDNLEQELKDYRKKAKQQKNLEKLVGNQSNKIKDLASQIKKFKIQKCELGRKLKEDKDMFNKFKMKKIKELLNVRKQNMKKQNMIKKLGLENTRNAQFCRKKEEELHRAKRINQTLKNLVKPSMSNNIKKNKETADLGTVQSSSKQSSAALNEKSCQQHILKCIQKILYQIDHQKTISKYEDKIQQLTQEIKSLLSDSSAVRLKVERLELKVQLEEGLSEEEEANKQEMQLNLNDIQERIANAEENLLFCQGKYNEILVMRRDEIFDVDVEVIYQKAYECVESLRVFVRAMFMVLKNVLADNYDLYEIKANLELDISTQKQSNAEMKEKMHQMQIEHQQALELLRQDLMMRYYTAIEEQETNFTSAHNMKRLQERQKKNYERKILDLSKTNRQISHEVEMWRRKCNVVQEKYQNMRSLLSKDKGIGRPNVSNKDLDQSFRQKRNNRTNMLDEINQMANQLDSLKMEKAKKMGSVEEVSQQLRQSQLVEKKEEEDEEFEYQVNKWECLGKIDAHNSSVLSIATHANMLISTSTKSLKIWDLETSKIISDLSGAHLTGLVKYVLVDPQRNIMLTACQKVVTIWDLITLNVECTLKGHKDEVRTMLISNDMLFTGGKGLANSGSLLTWDLRSLDPNKPHEEKERNQDIFTFASRNNILYYGTRNHHVRRMDMTTMEILAPFQPPHMDTVTGLAVVGDKMVSGSKDKNLRLWSLDQSVGNLKSTTHAFNDYVTTVHSDKTMPIFYSGSKDGQIKVGSIKNEKIAFLGGILAHTQSVNAISTLDESNTIASASADKTIKLWKPTAETSQKIQRQFY